MMYITVSGVCSFSALLVGSKSTFCALCKLVEAFQFLSLNFGMHFVIAICNNNDIEILYSAISSKYLSERFTKVT